MTTPNESLDPRAHSHSRSLHPLHSWWPLDTWAARRNTTRHDTTRHECGTAQVFEETDFKFTDGIPYSQRFKSLSIRKVDELVAYGLAGEKAPSLKTASGVHLEADEYHKVRPLFDAGTPQRTPNGIQRTPTESPLHHVSSSDESCETGTGVQGPGSRVQHDTMAALGGAHP